MPVSQIPITILTHFRIRKLQNKVKIFILYVFVKSELAIIENKVREMSKRITTVENSLNKLGNEQYYSWINTYWKPRINMP